MKRNIFNYFEDCLPENHNFSDEVFETGACCFCGSPCDEVVDIELINFYLSMGLESEFINPHLPRLRKYLDKTLSMDDIGREISRHIAHGECGEKGSCQGYSLETRKDLKYNT
jgi:hypothetical protein